MVTKKDKHLAAAQKFLERGQQGRALDELVRVVHEDGNDTRTWLRMAELHVQRGALPEARDIYLRTAEIYVSQGFLDKAVTVYRSILKLTPGLPAARERLGEIYWQLGRVADALRELELAADEFAKSGRAAEALAPLRRIVGLHPDNVGSRIRLAEMASKTGATEEAIHELREAAAQLIQQGRNDEFVRVAERLLFLCPTDVSMARALATSYIARRNPRLALVKLQAALRAAPRDPDTVALLAEAMAQLDAPKAISVWRELAEIHDAAGRLGSRDACVRAALVLDPNDAETRQLATRWGIAAGSAVSAGRARGAPPPLPPDAARPAALVAATEPAPGLARLGISGLIAGAGAGSVPGPMTDVDRILSEADVFVKYGLAERAVDHLRRVFPLHPEHRGARERLASVLNQLGRHSEAAAELATLASQLAAQGNTEAAGIAERALILDSSSAVAAKILGRLPAAARPSAADELADELEQVDFFLDQSLTDEARAALAELEERFPGHAALAEKRRALPLEDDALPGAVPGEASAPVMLQTPVAKLGVLDPVDPGTHGDLGIAYKQMGLHDAAIAEFKQVTGDKSRAVFAVTMIGECLEAKGDLGQAVARYKEALNMSEVTVTESLELYYLLGGVFERLGDVREALYFFENLGKRDAHFRDVERRIAALRRPSAHRV